MLIQLITGDESGDGHGMVETVIIESNLNRDELVDAYRKGCAIIGFDFAAECCSESEDNEISDEHHEKLAAHISEDFLKLDWMTTDYFVQIYLEICRLGDPTLVCRESGLPSIYINGYGITQF